MTHSQTRPVRCGYSVDVQTGDRNIHQRNHVHILSTRGPSEEILQGTWGHVLTYVGPSWEMGPATAMSL